MIKEYFKIAVKNLRTRQLRSWLTILGIVIGVFLIISLISLSQGLKDAVLKQMSMMGNDLIIIFPGQLENIFVSLAGGLSLSDDDLKAVERVNGVEAVLPMVYKAAIVKYQGKSKTLLIYGADWRNYLEIYQNNIGWQLAEGSWPVAGKRELIIGSLVPQEIFPGMKIGTNVSIGGRQFQVVGILESQASKTDDSELILDLDIYRDITGDRRGAASAVVKVKDGFSADKVAEDIKKELAKTAKRVKGQEQDTLSFSVLTSEKVAGIVGSVMGLIQAVIIGFASIAIIVGGIGIMNTMYTSVRERTREIGILKAVGAKTSTIHSIFLIESGIIGLIGGIGGVILGLLFAKSLEAIAQVHPVFYIKASASPLLVLFGLGFSFLVGCLSGFLPAREAAKLKPIEALRYE